MDPLFSMALHLPALLTINLREIKSGHRRFLLYLPGDQSPGGGEQVVLRPRKWHTSRGYLLKVAGTMNIPPVRVCFLGRLVPLKNVNIVIFEAPRL